MDTIFYSYFDSIANGTNFPWAYSSNVMILLIDEKVIIIN